MDTEVRKKKRKSVSYRKKSIFILSLFLVTADIGISLLVVRDIRRQDTQYMSNMVQLYIREEDQTFFKLGRQMLSVLIGGNVVKSEINENLAVLEADEADRFEVNVATMELRNIFLEYTWNYGTNYRFFIYLGENGRYVDLSLEKGSHPEMEAAVRELIQEGSLNTYSAKSIWTCVSLDSETYILKVMCYGNRYMGCYIDANALLKPLEGLDFNNHGFAVLVDGDENVAAVGRGGRWRKERCIMDAPFEQAPFRVRIYMDDAGIYGKYVAVHVLLLILGMIIFSTMFVLNLYLQRRVLRPIQRFADNLLKFDGQDQLVYDLTENELKELEQANEQFRNLLHQIRRLKITLYENELRKQKMQTEYLQLQIKPHFYINCLSFICQMVELGYYENAKKMTHITSDYFRYLFQSNRDFVEIRHELAHVGNYLEIQKLRYGDGFSYYIEQEEDTFEGKIPPLVIQTFVENAVHHISMEKPEDITIIVTLEENGGSRYFNICISDTGEGFPQQVLEALEKNKALETVDGHRVGITNCIHRLRYFYGNRGKIKFHNNPAGGAVVMLHLPEEGRGKNPDGGED